MEPGDEPKRGKGRANRSVKIATSKELGADPKTPGLKQESSSSASSYTSDSDNESAKRWSSSESPTSGSSFAGLSLDDTTTTVSTRSPSSTVDPTDGAGSTTSTARSQSSTAPLTRKPNFDKRGEYGVRFPVVTNYFEMNKKSGFRLNQYRVDFDPPEDNTDTKKQLFRAHAEELGAYIFDGSMMYRTDLLPEKCEMMHSSTTTGLPFIIRSRLVGHVNHDDPMFLQFYNIVMRNCLKILDMEELGRNFYDWHARIEMLEDGLELWPGYVTAIRNHELGTFLCVEVTHKVLRTSSVLKHILDVMDKFKDNRERAKDIIRKDLVTQIVMTHYNRKTYRIDEVDFDSTPKGILFGSTEDCKETYMSYYKSKYDIKIDDVEQPMLVSYPKKKDVNKKMNKNIYLVPSLCNFTGLTDEQRKNYQLMQRLSTNLHMNPNSRKKRLDAFMKRLGETPGVQEEFKKWNINFSPQYINAEARNLGVETIYLKGQKEVTPDMMGDWTFGLKRNPLALAVPLTDWLLYAPEIERNNIEKFVDGIKQQGRVLGMQVEAPAAMIFYDGRRDLEMTKIGSALKQRDRSIKFVFFVLPNNLLKRYATVKKFFVLQHEIATQCFVAKNIHNKSFGSICTKVMIQVNAKLGGEPWHLKVPVKDLMVLGFDVYHCAERKNESVGALVSTINKNLTRYCSTVSFHKDKKELSSNMCNDTKYSLDAYYSTNKSLPSKIILFRDGVGEGQINFVLTHEIEHMKLAIAEKYKEKNFPFPNFAFVIVTKKINTRILVKQKYGGYTNPAPGTIVDDIITLPERYDFFLISQNVRQGTVSPCNYNVVYDESGLSPDRLQRLTYKMCHLYFNWSGTVAVPAPCQYAHKLAYLTGVALNDRAPERLADLLWYL